MFGDLTTVAGRDVFIPLWVWPFLSVLCLGVAAGLSHKRDAKGKRLDALDRFAVVINIIFGLVTLGVSTFFWGMKLFWD